MEPLRRFISLDSSISDRETIDRLLADRKRGSPSSGATVRELRKTQDETCLDAVYNNRPLYDLAPPPVIIYHPAFARSARSCPNLLIPPLCSQLTSIGSGMHQPICPVLRGQEISSGQHDRCFLRCSRTGHTVSHPLAYSSCSHWHVPAGVIGLDTSFEGFRPIAAIGIELNKEIGTGDCDPLAQAQAELNMLCSFFRGFGTDVYHITLL